MNTDTFYFYALGIKNKDKYNQNEYQNSISKQLNQGIFVVPIFILIIFLSLLIRIYEQGLNVQVVVLHVVSISLNITVLVQLINIFHQLSLNKFMKANYHLVQYQSIMLGMITLQICVEILQFRRTHNEPDQLYTQLNMTMKIQYLYFFSVLLITNYSKMLVQSELLMQIMFWTYQNPNELDNVSQMMTTFLCVGQLLKSISDETYVDIHEKIQKERIQMSSRIMHNLRNYIYSLYDLSEMIHDDKLINNHDKNNPNDPNNNVMIEFDKNMNWIIYNISQVYHLDLIHDQSYTLKVEHITLDEMYIEIADKFRTIFYNKQIHLTIQQNTSLDKMKFDKNVLQQLIFQITADLYENLFDDIKIQFDYKKFDDFQYMQIYFKHENKDKIVFKDKFQISLLLENIQSNHQYNFEQTKEQLYIQLQFPIESNLSSLIMEIPIDFDPEYQELEFSQSYETIEITSLIQTNKELNLSIDVISAKETPEEVQEEVNETIQINLDDEQNILRMNTRIFSKIDLKLICCRTINEFLVLLEQIYHDKVNLPWKKNRILAIVDHMLDREQGYEAIKAAVSQNETYNLNITQVLLSSTEDKETFKLYEPYHLMKKIVKPLNKTKLNDLLLKFDKYTNYNSKQMLSIISDASKCNENKSKKFSHSCNKILLKFDSNFQDNFASLFISNNITFKAVKTKNEFISLVKNDIEQGCKLCKNNLIILQENLNDDIIKSIKMIDKQQIFRFLIINDISGKSKSTLDVLCKELQNKIINERFEMIKDWQISFEDNQSIGNIIEDNSLIKDEDIILTHRVDKRDHSFELFNQSIEKFEQTDR